MQILTQVEREQIAFDLRLKRGIRAIARHLHRDPGVICRELQRNRQSDGTYDPHRAQKKADLRSRKTNRRKLETDWQLHDWVQGKLRTGWSPELIAGRLKEEPPSELCGATISHEQIYQYIYEGEGRWEGWYHLLHRKHFRRRTRKGRKSQAKTLIRERVSIHERPKVVDERARYGDWESDLAVFRKQREALSVQYERKAMAIRLHRVSDKTAAANGDAITETLSEFPAHLRKSLTFDNGGEGACHTEIRDEFNLQTFFCDPYSSWQKGGVENAIGLIRRFLPSRTDLATLTDADLYQIQEKLNNRPRKKLNFRTPNEVLSVALNS